MYTVFVVLSFEGPDGYSLAGGLGVRASRLSTALAGQGFETHIFFIGDPWLEGYLTKCNGLLTQHRWCQWISRYHPIGVYDGEEGKLNDFTVSIPEYIVETIARPAVISGKQLVVLAEEWHTAESLCRISDLLFSKGLRDKALLLWNANNTLLIKGEKHQEEEQKGENFVRMERRYGKFARNIPLPSQCSGENVKARFKNGVLTVQIPKDEQSRARRIEIES